MIANESSVLLDLAKKEIKSEKEQSEKLRSIMLDLIKELDYDESYIIGDNRQFWKEGMSEAFKSTPRKFGLTIENRNSKTIKLEDTHVALYNSCLLYTSPSPRDS